MQPFGNCLIDLLLLERSPYSTEMKDSSRLDVFTDATYDLPICRSLDHWPSTSSLNEQSLDSPALHSKPILKSSVPRRHPLRDNIDSLETQWGDQRRVSSISWPFQTITLDLFTHSDGFKVNGFFFHT